MVVTSEDIRPWLNHAEKFALLGDGRFEVVGGREDMTSCESDLARELLATESTRN